MDTEKNLIKKEIFELAKQYFAITNKDKFIPHISNKLGVMTQLQMQFLKHLTDG